MQQQRVRTDVGKDDSVVGSYGFRSLREVALCLVRGHVAQIEGRILERLHQRLGAEMERHGRELIEALDMRSRADPGLAGEQDLVSLVGHLALTPGLSFQRARCSAENTRRGFSMRM